jgi:hypothetical protein
MVVVRSRLGFSMRVCKPYVARGCAFGLSVRLKLRWCGRLLRVGPAIVWIGRLGVCQAPIVAKWNSQPKDFRQMGSWSDHRYWSVGVCGLSLSGVIVFDVIGRGSSQCGCFVGCHDRVCH